MDDLRERLIRALEDPIGYGGTNSEDSYEKYDEMRLQAASAMRQMQAELRAIRTAAFNEARERAAKTAREMLLSTARPIRGQIAEAIEKMEPDHG